MSAKLKYAALLLIGAIGAHLYLVLHFYDLKFGAGAGQSKCNVGELFNCDAVAISRFSALFDIPLAAYGATTNLILFGMVIIVFFKLTDNRNQLLRYAFWTSTFIALMSVVMGLISVTFLTAYCIVCLITYVISILVFELLRRELDENPWPHMHKDFIGIFTHSRGVFISTFIAIPAIAFLSHRAMLSQYSATDVTKFVKYNIQEWKQNPTVDFTVKPSLSKGPERSKAFAVITEFADFRCGHCGKAAPGLSAFARANPNVRMEFYNFPLDGACNKVIGRSNGISCRLAKAVHCASSAGKGWALHDLIFEHQQEINHLRAVAQIDEKLEAESKKISLDWNQVKACMDDPATHDQITSQADNGDKAKIQGTPTVFVNGKMLPNGQNLLVLEKVFRSISGE